MGSPEERIWLFTACMWCIFLRNVFISLHRSWCLSSWRSKLSRSLYLHSYFMLNSNIFLQKQHNKLTLTSVMRIWCVDTIIAGGWFGGIKRTLPSSPIHSLAPFTCRYFSYLTSFFPFFLHCGTWSQAISPFDGQSAWHIQKNQQWTTHKLNTLNVEKKIRKRKDIIYM